jgi:hypothetical protein
MLTGGCLCGSVRFEVSSELGPIVYCHCSLCRRASGSAFGSNASVQASAFRIRQGENVVTEYESTPGYFRAFCSRCGSPLYGRHKDYPSFRRVRLGTFDGDPGGRPVANIWLDSKAPWHHVADSLDQFAASPPRSYYFNE